MRILRFSDYGNRHQQAPPIDTGRNWNQKVRVIGTCFLCREQVLCDDLGEEESTLQSRGDG